VLAVVTTTAGAQECRPDEQVPWWERRVFGKPPANRAERAVTEANMGAAENLVRKTAYATPRGFAVRPVWSFGDPPTGSRLYRYEYATTAFAACSKYDEHGSDFTVTFNPEPQEWSEGDRPMPDENGDGLYTEQVRTEPLFGAIATYSHFQETNALALRVLFTVGGESPTIPATREEYLRALIFTLEGKNQEKVKEVLELASKTQYQRWLERAAERKKGIEDVVAGVTMVDPSQAKKVRADLEAADRQAGEQLKKEEPGERAELEKMKANATAAGDRFRAQIAAMTPAERASPAWTNGMDLVPAGSPNAHAILRRNPAFYRVRTTSSAPRAILVTVPGPHDQNKALHRQMFGEFDWEALKRLLRN
jgi:hypothetical protein